MHTSFPKAIASSPVSIKQLQLKWVNYNSAVLCFESISSNLRSVNYGRYLTLDFSPLPPPEFNVGSARGQIRAHKKNET